MEDAGPANDWLKSVLQALIEAPRMPGEANGSAICLYVLFQGEFLGNQVMQSRGTQTGYGFEELEETFELIGWVSGCRLPSKHLALICSWPRLGFGPKICLRHASLAPVLMCFPRIYACI